MSLGASIASELEQEARSTRKLLERVPEQHFDWKPHPKSMSLRELASHVVDSMGWVDVTLNQDVFEMDPTSYKPYRAQSRKELLQKLDTNVTHAVKAIKGVSDAKLMETWSMKVAGKTAFSMPKIAVLKTFIINHQIHHRGQLDVYLRLKDVPLPQIYGPSADEPDMIPPGA